MKKLLILTLLVLTSNQFFAQTSTKNNSTFYVDVFINKDKDIRLENGLVSFDNVGKEVKKIIYDHPYKQDETVIYRVFADENLQLGYIMDVEQKMFQAYNQNTRRERYLLATVEMKIDGSNWHKKIEGLELDNIKG